MVGGTSESTSEAVRGLVARAADVPVGEMGDDVDLFGLGLDSLDLASVLIDVEDLLDRDLPLDLVEDLFQRGELRVGDVLAAVGSLR